MRLGRVVLVLLLGVGCRRTPPPAVTQADTDAVQVAPPVAVPDVGPPAPLEAVALQAPPREARAYVVSDRRVVVQSPEAARGTVVLFHGRGGGGSSWFDRPETAVFTRAMVKAGYAVVAPDSADREEERWEPGWPDNHEVLEIGRLLRGLRRAGLVPAEGPTYGVGMSNGGGFVVMAGTALGFDAIVVSHAHGMPRVYRSGRPTPPVLQVYSPRDGTVFASRVEEAMEEARVEGVEVRPVRLAPLPVTEGLLLHVPGITPRQAAEVLAAWRAAGVLDGSSFLTEAPSDKGAWDQVAFRAVPALRPYRRGLRDVLEAAYGGHAFRSDVVPEVLAWFLAHPG